MCGCVGVGKQYTNNNASKGNKPPQWVEYRRVRRALYFSNSRITAHGDSTKSGIGCWSYLGRQVGLASLTYTIYPSLYTPLYIPLSIYPSLYLREVNKWLTWTRGVWSGVSLHTRSCTLSAKFTSTQGTTRKSFLIIFIFLIADLTEMTISLSLRTIFLRGKGIISARRRGGARIKSGAWMLATTCIVFCTIQVRGHFPNTLF